jgi:hypothetical protein
MPKPKANLGKLVEKVLSRGTIEEQEVEEGAVSIEKSANSTLRPSRIGKRIVAGYFDTAVSRQLRHLSADEDRPIQDLLREALNDFFVKKGKPPIA